MCEDFYNYFASAPIIYWVVDNITEYHKEIIPKFHFDHQFLNELSFGDKCNDMIEAL